MIYTYSLLAGTEKSTLCSEKIQNFIDYDEYGTSKKRIIKIRIYLSKMENLRKNLHLDGLELGIDTKVRE